uniref:Putative homing endonuclease n=1 Tax=viral metagenome TaxID=1070528 RepID=A0A6M3XPS9_9ZZZZ
MAALGRPKIALPTADIVARYAMGDSTYAIGLDLGVSYSTVRRRLLAAGVGMRSPGRAGGFQIGNKLGLGNYKRGGSFFATGNGYLCTSDRNGKQCALHRGCWEARHGDIPSDHVVHHADGNRQNNDIGNLVCMPMADHGRLHNLRGH